MDRFALVVGEALVDLIEDTDADGSSLFRPRLGGSPLNVAVGLRRLGAPVEFVGAFGHRLREFLRGEGIGVDLSMDAGMGTCLSVATTQDGFVNYEYFGDAASMIQITPVDPAVVAGAAVIHAGSTVFNADPAYSTVIAAYAQDGPFRTLDPNPRPFLIPDLDEYRVRLEIATSMVDLIKLSGEDVSYLYPGIPAEDAARRIRGVGTATVIMTRADADTLLLHGDAVQHIPVPLVTLVDPTGAGDSFMASLLSDIVANGAPTSVHGWAGMVVRANTAAGMTCGSVGGAESMPRRADLDVRLAQLGSTDTSLAQSSSPSL